MRPKTLPRPKKSTFSVDEGYEIVVPSYENTGKQELEVLGFSSLRRYKVWPKETTTEGQQRQE